MFKHLLLATALTVATVLVTAASPISGLFSLASFSRSYFGGTAATATGLDFGTTFGGSGNGYGYATNGTAFVGNSAGSFAGLDDVTASISDIALGATANPYAANSFVSFGGASAITVNFSDASLTRSPVGTSVTSRCRTPGQ